MSNALQWNWSKFAQNRKRGSRPKASGEEDQKTIRIQKEAVERHKDHEMKNRKREGKKKCKAREEEEHEIEIDVSDYEASPPSKNSRPQNKKKQIKKGESSSSSGPKMNFSLSLSDKEIADDFMFMTGRWPPRRPNKRAKATTYKPTGDKYPGSLLHLVQPKLYKVKESKQKGLRRRCR